MLIVQVKLCISNLDANCAEAKLICFIQISSNNSKINGVFRSVFGRARPKLRSKGKKGHVRTALVASKNVIPLEFSPFLNNLTCGKRKVYVRNVG